MTFTVALNLRETDVPGRGEQLDSDQEKQPHGGLSSLGGQDQGRTTSPQPPSQEGELSKPSW